jgi:hypothetical protein
MTHHTLSAVALALACCLVTVHAQAPYTGKSLEGSQLLLARF